MLARVKREMEEEQPEGYRFLSGEPAYIEAVLAMTKNSFSKGGVGIRIAFPYDVKLLPQIQADLSYFLGLENIQYRSFLEKGDVVNFLLLSRPSEKTNPRVYLSEKRNYVQAILVLFHNARNLGCTELTVRAAFTPEINTLVMADIVQLFSIEKLTVIVFEKDGFIFIRSPLQTLVTEKK